MSSWTTYKGLDVPDSATGDAGINLTDDLKALADRAPYQAASNPTINDDVDDGFIPGSQWLNTSTLTMWVCTDNTSGAAKWRSLYRRIDNAVVLAPEAGVGGTDNQSVILGGINFAVGKGSIASGTNSYAYGSYSTAQGGLSVSGGECSHAEGLFTYSGGDNSHAEGGNSYTYGAQSHAEGSGTRATGISSHSEGFGTYAYAQASHTGGIFSKTLLTAQWARASGGYSDDRGTAQTTLTQLFRLSTDATSTELTIGGGSPSSDSRFIIRDGQTLSCFINIVGRKENGGANDHVSFLRQVLIRRESSTTSLVGSVQTIGTDINPAGWGGVNITADDTNESLKIEVTGAASTDIRWMATVMASEVADATI